MHTSRLLFYVFIHMHVLFFCFWMTGSVWKMMIALWELYWIACNAMTIRPSRFNWICSVSTLHFDSSEEKSPLKSFSFCQRGNITACFDFLSLLLGCCHSSALCGRSEWPGMLQAVGADVRLGLPPTGKVKSFPALNGLSSLTAVSAVRSPPPTSVPLILSVCLFFFFKHVMDYSKGTPSRIKAGL